MSDNQHIRALERRLRFLKFIHQSPEQLRSKKASAYDGSEIRALEWAIPRLRGGQHGQPHSFHPQGVPKAPRDWR